MDDARLVRKVERIGDLGGDGERLVDRDWSGRQPIGQRRPSTSSIAIALSSKP